MALHTELLAKPTTKTTHRTRLTVLFTGFLLFTIGVIYYHNDLSGEGQLKSSHIRFETKSDPESKAEELSTKPEVSSFNYMSQTGNNGTINGTIKQYPACPIPQLEPYHQSIKSIVDYEEILPEFNCTGSSPLLFDSTLQSTIVPAKGPDYFRDEGYESCCYRTEGESAEPSDQEMYGNKVSLPAKYLRYHVGLRSEEMYKYSNYSLRTSSSPPSFPVSLTTETKIRDGHEVIAIFCKRKGSNETLLVDVQAFVPLKPKEGNPSNEANGTEEKFNVVIFGLDAMSRMNFLRMMPQSHSFLMNELKAVEMLGYNKVGDNTLPNILPLLGSGVSDEVIWAQYAKQGYYTMVSEDGSNSILHATDMGYQGTDYYYHDLRPLTHFTNDKFKTYTCYGPRLTFQSLLDYMEKYVDTMSRNKKNFFEFTWATGLTHDYIHPALLGDPHLLKSLRWLKESGHLNNTILILMSDHGNRLDLIRDTIQGQLEERLPFLYFVVPEAFKIKYELAYKNLLSNADKLMTTIDLHKSLQDIANLDMVENGKLLEREDDLSRLGRNLTGGVSLFLPIPEFRTCGMAGIIMNYCSCTYLGVANVSDPEIDIVAKAKIAVSHINSLLASGGNNTNTTCATLELHNVSRVMRVGDDKDYWWSGYSINFETKPGGGQFEALLANVTYEGTHWKVQGPIVRTNRYGHQSHCVRNVTMKPYCYCLD